MTKQSIIVLVIVVALIGFGVWGLLRSSNTPDKVSSTNTNDSTNQNSNSAINPDLGCARNVNNETMQQEIDIKNKFVTLKVKDFGDIKVQLFDQDAPKTVENFLRLTNSGYYNCITFHRIAKGFVIQGGDPTGTGSGGESAFGGEFEDELNPNTESYKAGYAKGVLAMANRGPNTNTSQFFIMLDNVELPHNYTIFGKVVSGLDVVDKIGAQEIVPQLGPTDGAPVQKIIIDSATISSN
jgi:cyclophilin family peptidyl-prolyl cis-trans isomerase